MLEYVRISLGVDNMNPNEQCQINSSQPCTAVPVDAHLDFFQGFIIINSNAVNMSVHHH